MKPLRLQFILPLTCAIVIAGFAYGARAAHAQSFVPQQVGAGTDVLGLAFGGGTGLAAADPRIIAAHIINVALGLLGIVALGFILYAGFIWMTAAGNEEKIQTAKKILINAIIGMVIILSAVGIVTFVISKLTSAIEGGTGGGGGAGGAPGAGGFGGNIFFATSTPQGTLPIKNVEVDIDFLNGIGAPAPVDTTSIPLTSGNSIVNGQSATIQIVQMNSDGSVTNPAVYPAGAFALDPSFTIVKFVPGLSCADPAFPNDQTLNSHSDCFLKNTMYRVTLTSSLKSTAGIPLDCVTHSCVSTFTTGDKYDATPPSVTMVNPGDNAIIGDTYPATLSAEVSDDAGVDNLFFQAPAGTFQGQTGTSVWTQAFAAPYVGGNNTPALVSTMWTPRLTDPLHAQTVQMSATAHDLDSHLTASAAQNVKILPAWCFNNHLDTDKNEEQASQTIGEPDCGAQSECGACQGEGCNANLDCASGFCFIKPSVHVALSSDKTQYTATVTGESAMDQYTPYYAWSVENQPLTAVYLPMVGSADPSKLFNVVTGAADAVAHGAQFAQGGGKFGGSAYALTGGGNYIEAPNVAIGGGKQLTLAWWARFPSNPPQGLTLFETGDHTVQVKTVNDSTYGMSFSITVAGSQGAQNAIDNQSGHWPIPTDNAWHYFVIVIDGSALQNVHMFADYAYNSGAFSSLSSVQELGGALAGFNQAIPASSQSFFVGSKTNPSPVPLMTVGEVKVFQTALSSAQIQAEYAAAGSATPSPLAAFDAASIHATGAITAHAMLLKKSDQTVFNPLVPYGEKNGVCLNEPKITNVIQTSGAVGNYVTVIGQSFGAYDAVNSKVYFNSSSNPAEPVWTAADLCSAPSADAWHDNYVIVKVPPGATTGPIRISAYSTLLHAPIYDATNDNFGPVFDPTQVFAVTAVQSPGICGITPSSGAPGSDTFAISGTHFGSSQGTSEVHIGSGVNESAAGILATWTDALIGGVQVPSALLSGPTSVRVLANGAESNSIPFNVLTGVVSTAPFIANIAPSSATDGSLITIIGKNLGATTGQVIFSQNGSTFSGDLPNAQVCGNGTWSDSQVIIRVPQALSPGSVQVQITTAQGQSNSVHFSAVAGPPLPGLCMMTPDNGPIGTPLAFTGINFGSTGKVEYWQSVTTTPQGSAWSASHVRDAAPQGAQTGPVKLWDNDQGGQAYSNPLNFKVQNCQDELQKGNNICASPAVKCCADGACMAPGACPEDQQPGASVYAWQFSTGKLPVVPQVVEECTPGSSPSVAPSPTPSALWDSQGSAHSSVCVNASVAVRFTSLVSIPANSVIFEKCAPVNSDGTCGGTWVGVQNMTVVPHLFNNALVPEGYPGLPAPIDGEELFVSGGLLDVHTMYRVTLTGDIKSFVYDTVQNAEDPMLEQPLPKSAAASRLADCDMTAHPASAYCFKFTTASSNALCKIGSVVVSPDPFTAEKFNTAYPGLYNANPTAQDNSCWVLDPFAYDWKWNTGTQANNGAAMSSYATVTNNAAVPAGAVASMINPVHSGSLLNGTGGAAPYLSSPYSVAVSGSYAYVASPNSNALEIVDVSNPASPVHKASVMDGAGGAQLHEPYAVYVSGNYAYLASLGSNALEIVDVHDPANPAHAGSIINGVGGALLDHPQGVYVAGSYAYVASSNSNALEIVDVHDPAHPTHVGSYANTTLLPDVRSVFVSGNYAYVASAGGNALAVIDVSNPASPSLAGSLSDGGGSAPFLNAPISVFVSGAYAYLASYSSNTLEIVDIHDPAHPAHAGSISAGSGNGLPLYHTRSVFVSGKYAYVAADNQSPHGALSVIDISAPTAPQYVASISSGSNGALLTTPTSVFVSGNYAYVTSANSNALEIVNLYYSAKKGLPTQDMTTNKQETPAGGGDQVWAQTEQDATHTVNGFAVLHITLPKPEALDYWPKCSTACVNAGIGALFNTVMDVTTFNNNASMQNCGSANSCAGGAVTSLTVSGSNSSQLAFAFPSGALSPNTNYTVTIKGGAGGVKSESGSAMPSDFSWTFRTKDALGGSGLCAIDKVGLSPKAATVNIVGEKAKYSALPYGAPDECSPNGEILNASSYNWQWQFSSSDLAGAVTHLTEGGEQASPFCTQACLWSGSQPPPAQGYCGDGAVGPGEDCDSPGIGACGYNCLLLPSAKVNKGTLPCTTPGQFACCGNGGPYGKPEAGEDCDLGSQNGVHGSGCTSSCLHEGTILSYNDCLNIPGLNTTDATSPDYNKKVCAGGTVKICDQSTGASYAQSAASAAVSACSDPKLVYTVTVRPICGDGHVEIGEECDLGVQNGKPGSPCSSTCLLQAVSFGTGSGQCGNGIIDPANGEECDDGAQNGKPNDPCTSDCRLRGSSIDYAMPSYCGNGIVEAGEACDFGSVPDQAGTSQYGSPLQYGYATSILSATAKAQYQATVTAVASGKTSADTNNFVLQCGFAPPDSACPATTDATHAAAANSCCFPRPKAEIAEPANTTDVCPNALLKVDMSDPSLTQGASVGEVDKTTMADNIQLVAATTTIANCPAGTTQFAVEKVPAKAKNFWQNILFAIKNFFGFPAQATNLYCSDGLVPLKFDAAYDASSSRTSITITPAHVLAQAATYRLYVLNNDPAHGYSGLKDTLGLSFIDAGNLKQTIYTEFTTKNVPFCKINKLTITITPSFAVPDLSVPNSALATSTSEQTVFTLNPLYVDSGVQGDPGQTVTSAPGVYDWTYAWNKSDAQSAVHIADWSPVPASTDISAAAVAKKNGSVDITGEVDATDSTQTPSVQEQIPATATLNVELCDHPWPSAVPHYLADADASIGGTVSVAGKAWTNFKTWYCMDTNVKGACIKPSGASSGICSTDGITACTEDAQCEETLPELKSPAILTHQSSNGACIVASGAASGICSNDDAKTCASASDCPDPVLKEFFFTFNDPLPGSTIKKDADSIGLRVYPNIDHKPLMSWYNTQPWIPKGHPSPTAVGNYEALQEGRTYYIAGLNVNDPSLASPNVYTNVYVWSYSDNPSAETQNIVNQLIANFTLNFNMNNPRVCAPDASLSCSSDLDCPLSYASSPPSVSACNAPLDKLKRDLARVKDITAFANNVEQYKTLNGGYPDLKNNPQLGTFLPGKTYSAWKSWQGVLANQLGGALPVDPLNIFNGCGSSTLSISAGGVAYNLGNFDSSTCWDAKDSLFACPAGSSVYDYEFTSSTKATVKAQFELSAWQWQKPWNDPSFITNPKLVQLGSVCTDQVSGVSGTCGDGIVESSEVCELGQTKSFSCTHPQGTCSGQNNVLCATDNDCAKFSGSTCGNFVQAPNLWSWGQRSYSEHRVVACKNDCSAWGGELPATQLKVCSNNPDTACTQDSDCASASGGTGACDISYKRCKTEGNLCVHDSDCNPSSPGECHDFAGACSITTTQKCLLDTDCPSGETCVNQISPVCVPNGYCGDGIVQNGTDPSQPNYANPPEVCDDGKNNGKPGYCNLTCTGKTPGACGDGEIILNNATGLPDDTKKICDSSALFFNLNAGPSQPQWLYNPFDSAVTVGSASGIIAYSDHSYKKYSGKAQFGWCSNDNTKSCLQDNNCTPPGTCLFKGAKYNLDKLQSCSWDCKSFNYCGDGKVDSAYEDCDTNTPTQSCSVGLCKDKNHAAYIDTTLLPYGELCESDADCYNLTTPPSCVSSHCDANSGNSGSACQSNADCMQQYTCQDYQQGKRYCRAPGQVQPVFDSTTHTYSDGSAMYTDQPGTDAYKSCKWETVGSEWETSGGTAKSATCLPLKAVPIAADTGTCGDGIINDGKTGADGAYLPGHGPAGAVPEVCDTGAAVGAICTAGYGKTCTYCAYGCGQIVTVSGGYCGDNKLEPEEKCDASAAPTALYIDTTTSNACTPNATNITTCVPNPAVWSSDTIASCTAHVGNTLVSCNATCTGAVCKQSKCGDGVVDYGENCDCGDGTVPLPAGCTAKNGTVPTGLTYGQTQQYCDTSCHFQTTSGPHCGDGIINGAEECDTNTDKDPSGKSPVFGSINTCPQGQSPTVCKTGCTIDTNSCSSIATCSDIMIASVMNPSKLQILYPGYDITKMPADAFHHRLLIKWTSPAGQSMSVEANAANNYTATLCSQNVSSDGTLTVVYENNDNALPATGNYYLKGECENNITVACACQQAYDWSLGDPNPQGASPLDPGICKSINLESTCGAGNDFCRAPQFTDASFTVINNFNNTKTANPVYLGFVNASQSVNIYNLH